MHMYRAGSYRCGCNQGYILQADGRSCNIRVSVDQLYIVLSSTNITLARHKHI